MAFSSSNAFAPMITGGGLSLHVDDGVLFVNGVRYVIAETDVTLAANATNQVYVDTLTGLVTVGLSFPTNCVPVATVVTGVRSITTVTDARADVVSSGAPESGWTDAGETFTFASADSPTFTFTIAGIDRTTRYTLGTRIKLTQSTGGTKYFIVTKVAFATDTTVTVYGGTDYTLNNEAITLPTYSRVKAPAGFPPDPAKWTQTFTDSADRSQASPVTNTWYNIGTLVLNIPIGAWLVEYAAEADVNGSSGTADIGTSLSTSSSSESDTSMSARTLHQVGVAGIRFINPHSRRRYLTLSAKADYFLIFRTTGAAQSAIDIRGDLVPTVIRAVSTYL